MRIFVSCRPEVHLFRCILIKKQKLRSQDRRLRFMFRVPRGVEPFRPPPPAPAAGCRSMTAHEKSCGFFIMLPAPDVPPYQQTVTPRKSISVLQFRACYGIIAYCGGHSFPGGRSRQNQKNRILLNILCHEGIRFSEENRMLFCLNTSMNSEGGRNELRQRDPQKLIPQYQNTGQKKP